MYLKGAWEVEHSNPKSKGGTDRFNNLYASCIACNRSKSNRTTKQVRAKQGRTKAPLSKAKRNIVRKNNATSYGIVGGLIGTVAGLIGVAIGAAIRAQIGYDKNPDED